MGNTTWSRRNTRKLKFAKKVVVLRQRPLTLEYLDKHSWLVISSRREAETKSISHLVQRSKNQDHIHLRLASRNDSVTSDELSEHSTSSLDTEGKGADIHKDNIFSALFTGKDTTLDSSTISNCLIGVDTLRRLFAVEVLLQELLNLGDTGRATDEDNL